ncbi:MAG: hypothetical protein JNK37_08400 [Verrucomicrobiales bacterium]|nr:hypothetical protein [Verrucomicrobiales bacterium]
MKTPSLSTLLALAAALAIPAAAVAEDKPAPKNPDEPSKPTVKPAPADPAKPAEKKAPGEPSKPVVKKAPGEPSKPVVKKASGEPSKPVVKKDAPADSAKPVAKKPGVGGRTLEFAELRDRCDENGDGTISLAEFQKSKGNKEAASVENWFRSRIGTGTVSCRKQTSPRWTRRSRESEE